MKNNHQEDDKQKALFQYTEMRRVFKWLHAIPNGGKRDVREAQRLKLQGTKAGVHDMFLPKARGIYHGCYLEMKHGRNGLSDKQSEFAIDMISEGYCSFVCYDSIEAIEALELYINLKPGQSILTTCLHLSIHHITS